MKREVRPPLRCLLIAEDQKAAETFCRGAAALTNYALTVDRATDLLDYLDKIYQQARRMLLAIADVLAAETRWMLQRREPTTLIKPFALEEAKRRIYEKLLEVRA